MPFCVSKHASWMIWLTMSFTTIRPEEEKERNKCGVARGGTLLFLISLMLTGLDALSSCSRTRQANTNDANDPRLSTKKEILKCSHFSIY